MMRITELNNVTYCDFRIEVRDCYDSDFFYRSHLAGFVFTLTTWILQALLLLYRVIIRKDNPKSFRTGANGTMCFFLFSITIHTLQHGVVLFTDNRYANEIIWGLMYPSTLLIPVSYLSSIVDVLPNLRFLERGSLLKHLNITESKRHFLFASFASMVMATNVVLFALIAYYHEQGDYDTEGTLFQAATIFLGVSFFIFWLAFFYCGYLFIISANGSLDDLNKVPSRANNEEVEILVVTIKKTKQNIIGLSWNVFLLTFFFFVLAFYEDLLLDVPFCKALAIIIVNSVPELAFMMTILLIVADIKIARAKKKQSLRQTSSVIRETKTQQKETASVVVDKRFSQFALEDLEVETPALLWLRKSADPEKVMDEFLDGNRNPQRT